jgi:hypothetical protein
MGVKNILPTRKLQEVTSLRVRASSRSGHTSATYLVENGVATLLHRSEGRGFLRARAFALKEVA